MHPDPIINEEKYADWDNPYTTMSYKFEADIIRTLAKIIENGHVQKGERPVHWCIACGSALADAEVEYNDKESYAINVAFRSVDGIEIEGCFELCDELAN